MGVLKFVLDCLDVMDVEHLYSLAKGVTSSSSLGFQSRGCSAPGESPHRAVLLSQRQRSNVLWYKELSQDRRHS